MSPVLNCVPSSPPSEREAYPKPGSVPSDVGSTRHEESSPQRTESESSCCNDAPPPDPTNNNNNSIPLGYKKSPSPNGNHSHHPFESPVRPWDTSPGRSVSPSSSCHRNHSLSPDVSSENSRIPSRSSSAHDGPAASPNSFRSPKMCPSETSCDVSYVPDNRLGPSSDHLRLSNSFFNDTYFRLGHPLAAPFAPAPDFLVNPFFGGTDPKILLNNPGLGLITQQLHQQLNGFPAGKIPSSDLHRMSMQQLQFLQNHIQSLPTILQQPTPFGKLQEAKNPISMLLQARKYPKIVETDGENGRKDAFGQFATTAETKPKERKTKTGIEMTGMGKSPRKTSLEDDAMDTYEDNNSDSDEVLSVGSVSPPPGPARAPEAPPGHDLRLNGSSGTFNREITSLANGSKKYVNATPVRLQDGLTATKTAEGGTRTLKFSIDNILKSNFGNEDVARDEVKKAVDAKRTTATATPTPTPAKKKPEGEKEVGPVDLSQENGNGAPGSEAPMLWPAWVYCTRYSDRPSSGPRTRRSKNKDKNPEEKRPRTAFSGDQLSRLKHEFAENRYLTERRRQDLAKELGLNEAQIKIWFQNKRAKMKKARGEKNPLALQLMAQGLYNHSTVPLTKEEEEAAAAEMSD